MTPSKDLWEFHRNLDESFVHDLKNMLGLILRSGELGVECHNLSRDELVQLLAQVFAAAETAVDLVETYQFDRSAKTYDIAELVVRTAKAINTSPNICVVVHTPDQPVLTADDPGPLMRVLMNLADNARAAAGDNGTVTLSLESGDVASPPPEMTLGELPPPPFAVLTIADTGPGIPPKLYKRIWERGATTKGRSGSGRGLALVRDVIEGHDACLKLDTSSRSGTKFQVWWPLRPPHGDDTTEE